MSESENTELSQAEDKEKAQFNLVNHINSFSKEKRQHIKEISGAQLPVTGWDFIVRLQSAIPEAVSNYQMSLAIQTMADFQPKNALEGMLYSQLAALHFQGLEYLKRAEQASMRYHQDLDLNNAIKLIRLQNEIVEKLTRLKRNNAPKITFQSIKIDQLIFNKQEGDINEINGGPHEFEFSGHITNLSSQVEANRYEMQELRDTWQEGL